MNRDRHSFKMWERQILFEKNCFYYLDGKGGKTPISQERARQYERDYCAYQAEMDIDRGGQEEEDAYTGRGFVRRNGGWIMESYFVDSLPRGQTVIDPAEGQVTISDAPSVTRVSERAYKDRKKMTSVQIPKNIREIGGEAFSGCGELADIHFTESVERIGSGAFDGTAFFSDPANWDGGALYLENWLIAVKKGFRGALTVREGTVGVADSAGLNCTGLTGLFLPDSVQYLGSCAFRGCTGLVEARLPGKVLRCGVSVFKGCVSLRALALPEGVKDLGMLEGCGRLAEITVPSTLTDVDGMALRTTVWYRNAARRGGCLYLGGWLLEAPENIRGRYAVEPGTIGIAGGAFNRRDRLQEICLPDSVAYLARHAFSACAALEKVNIPPKVRVLRTWTFTSCPALKKVVIPHGVERAEQWALCDCPGLETVVVENPRAVLEPPLWTKGDPILVGSSFSSAGAYAARHKKQFRADKRLDNMEDEVDYE